MVGLTKSEKLEPWYAGPMSRAEAETTLADAPNGTFLVRNADTRQVLFFFKHLKHLKQLKQRSPFQNGAKIWI